MIERAAGMKRRFLLAAGLFSLTVFLLVWLAAGFSLARGVLTGCMIGLCDNYIMFADVAKGAAGKSLARALATMQRSIFKRLAFVAAAVFTSHKAGIALFPLFVAYIILHFVCLIFVVINALREQRGCDRDAERSEKVAGKQNS